MHIYGLEDTIPFYLELLAPIESLKAVFPTSTTGQAANTPRVYLMRQVAVEVRGQKAWRDTILGEGKLWPVPPRASSMPNDGLPSLNWEGELRCKSDVTSGSFNLGRLVVKDFIVLAVKPPTPEKSPFVELHHAHPIRLTTDSWRDTLPSESHGL